jgi:hypothetical protein
MDRRLPNGLIRGCTRTDEENEEGQHDLLALALHDAAEALGPDTAEGREFADYARDLFSAKARRLAASPRPRMPDPGEHLWMSGYFRRPRIEIAPGNILMFHYGGLQHYADAHVAKARWDIANLPPPPANIPVLARTFNGYIDLQLTAYDLTGERIFLDHAARLADQAVRDLFIGDLLMGASHMRLLGKGANCEYHADPWCKPDMPGLYYSVAGVPILVRTLLRLALKQEGATDILGVDLHSR